MVPWRGHRIDTFLFYFFFFFFFLAFLVSWFTVSSMFGILTYQRDRDVGVQLGWVGGGRGAGGGGGGSVPFDSKFHFHWNFLINLGYPINPKYSHPLLLGYPINPKYSYTLYYLPYISLSAASDLDLGLQCLLGTDRIRRVSKKYGNLIRWTLSPLPHPPAHPPSSPPPYHHHYIQPILLHVWSWLLLHGSL